VTSLHILGAGALGSLFAHRAIIAGYDVVLVTRKEEEHREITLERDSNHLTHLFRTQCVSDTHPINHLLIATKSYDVLAATKCISKNLSSGSTVAVLSNGMGYHDSLNALIPSHNLIAATTTAGCALISSSAVNGTLHQHYRQSGGGVTFFGHWEQSGDGMPDWLNPLIGSVERCSWSEDIQSLLIQKLVINAAINPCTALNDIPNGALATDPWRGQVIQAVEEINGVLSNFHGGAIPGSLQDVVDSVIADTAGNISSMLADVRAHRQTEHEAILGFLLEQPMSPPQPKVAAPLLQSWLEALRARARQL